jgi:hypothetical protein
VRHALHGTVLGPLFSLGPEPASGGLDTVNRGEPHPLGSFEVRAGPALRFAVNARDRDQARSVLPGGQSGDRLSPHYADQLPLFMAGQTKPTPVSRERLRVQQREIWHGRAETGSREARACAYDIATQGLERRVRSAGEPMIPEPRDDV